MIYLIKAALAILILFVSRTLASEYKKYTEKKLALTEGFLSLLSFIKNELSCRARPVPDWAFEFENAALSEVGFTKTLSESESLSFAFSSCVPCASMLPGEASRLLEGYFSAFGRSYRDEEEASASKTYDELDRILVGARSDLEKSVRAVRVLCYAAALGVIVLFI